MNKLLNGFNNGRDTSDGVGGESPLDFKIPTGYRTPTIEEFVQDFEYEILEKHSGSYDIIDFSTGKTECSEPWSTEHWYPTKVTWKAPKGFTTTKVGDIIYTIDHSIGNFLLSIPDSVLQERIDKGLIRCKIESNEDN